MFSIFETCQLSIEFISECCNWNALALYIGIGNSKFLPSFLNTLHVNELCFWARKNEKYFKNLDFYRFIFFFSIVFQDRNNKTDEKMKTISIKQKVVIDQQCLAYDDVEYNATYDKLLKTTFGNLPCCMKVVVKLYVKQ